LKEQRHGRSQLWTSAAVFEGGQLALAGEDDELGPNHWNRNRHNIRHGSWYLPCCPGFDYDLGRLTVVSGSLLERVVFMTDEHQSLTVIATALLDTFKDDPDRLLGAEEAKIIAKRIVAALELFAGTGFLRVWVCHDVGHDGGYTDLHRGRMSRTEQAALAQRY
jgi:hypothetical protein